MGQIFILPLHATFDMISCYINAFISMPRSFVLLSPAVFARICGNSQQNLYDDPSQKCSENSLVIIRLSTKGNRIKIVPFARMDCVIG